MVGSHAAEIIQMGIALGMGATKADFDRTSLHPSISKSSSPWAEGARFDHPAPHLSTPPNLLLTSNVLNKRLV